jgi:hypothetical protein
MTAPAKPRTLRDAMPVVFAFIDDMRAAFGPDDINAIVKAGIAGLPGFWASEGGQEVGTRYVHRGTEISAAQMVILSLEKDKNADRNPPRR